MRSMLARLRQSCLGLMPYRGAAEGRQTSMQCQASWVSTRHQGSHSSSSWLAHAQREGAHKLDWVVFISELWLAKDVVAPRDRPLQHAPAHTTG